MTRKLLDNSSSAPTAQTPQGKTNLLSNAQKREVAEENLELSLSRDPSTGNMAVIAGDGLDFRMYIFNKAGEVIASDECGLSCNIPYITPDEYLHGFKHNLSLAQIIQA